MPAIEPVLPPGPGRATSAFMLHAADATGEYRDDSS